MRDDALRQAILDLGLEDDISRWEVTSDCRKADLIADGWWVSRHSPKHCWTSHAGTRSGFSGRWDDPAPRHVNLDEAATLLADARRYYSDEEIANDLERVYYVNVDNIVK